MVWFVYQKTLKFLVFFSLFFCFSTRNFIKQWGHCCRMLRLPERSTGSTNYQVNSWEIKYLPRDSKTKLMIRPSSLSVKLSKGKTAVCPVLTAPLTAGTAHCRSRTPHTKTVWSDRVCPAQCFLNHFLKSLFFFLIRTHQYIATNVTLHCNCREWCLK